MVYRWIEINLNIFELNKLYFIPFIFDKFAGMLSNWLSMGIISKICRMPPFLAHQIDWINYGFWIFPQIILSICTGMHYPVAQILKYSIWVIMRLAKLILI